MVVLVSFFLILEKTSTWEEVEPVLTEIITAVHRHMAVETMNSRMDSPILEVVVLVGVTEIPLKHPLKMAMEGLEGLV
jgi:hypothetical protein